MGGMVGPKRGSGHPKHSPGAVCPSASRPRRPRATRGDPAARRVRCTIGAMTALEQPARMPSSGSERRAPSWARQAALVLGKDLSIEISTGEVVVTGGFFALLVVVMASLAFYTGPASRALVAAGVIWLSVAFAAVLALGRSWQREREESALEGLLVA